MKEAKAYREPSTEVEANYKFDFGIHNSDLAIEVISFKLLDKIEEIKKYAQKLGKRLLVLTNEEIIEDINSPAKVAAKIEAALNSTEKLIISSSQPVYEQLFISHNLVKKYPANSYTKLHVDVNIVENDVLDISKAKDSLQFKNANFKIDEDGKFTCSAEVEKMSKSKFNVVNPDVMIDKHGADCFRMFEMFLGPIEQAKPWDTNGISGVAGFLRKLWSLFHDVEKGKVIVNDDEPTKDELKALHQCIKDVTSDIERFSLNTCVSNFMKCVNELKKINCSKRLILNDLAILLAPFAPYTAEELWSVLGNEPSVHHQSYPMANESYLVSDTVSYPIAVNGKTRDVVDFAADATQADIETAVMSNEKIVKHLEGKTPKKIIFVKGKMVNVVI